jgi:hypothetical protein
MKPWLIPVIAGLSILLSQCTPWPTRFEEIDGHRPRVLDFVFQNYRDTTLCEFAPGDTVLLKAYFAGQPVQSLLWQASFNVLMTDLGQDTAVDIEALAPLSVSVPGEVDSCFSEGVYCARFAFRIPPDILHRNALIKQAVAGMPLVGGISLDPDTMLNLLDAFAAMPPGQRAALGGPIYDSLKSHGADLLQLLTAKVRIFATVNGIHRSQSDLTVRYNRLFTDLDGVGVNRNPVIHYIAIHKVKGEAGPSFGPGDLGAADTTFLLYLAGQPDAGLMGPNIVAGDTILLDSGYTYFAAVDSGAFDVVSQLDTCYTYQLATDTARAGKTTLETFFVLWQYDYADSAADTAGLNDRMILTDSNPFSRLYPPAVADIGTIKLWVQVYDSFLGERYRPSGSTLREVALHFKYTDAYLRSAK